MVRSMTRVSHGRRPTTRVRCVSVEEGLWTAVARKHAACSVLTECLPLMTAAPRAQVGGWWRHGPVEPARTCLCAALLVFSAKTMVQRNLPGLLFVCLFISIPWLKFMV